MRQLFISYARENKPDVEALVRDLDALGCQTWVDSSLRGGQTWWEEIVRRIADCDVFLVIVSGHTLNSVACKRELDWALALNKPVLPVAVERRPDALPRTLSMRQIVDYSRSGREAAFALAGALGTLPPAPPPPEQLPEPPPAPLSYLSDLIDQVSQPDPLTQEQQHQILIQLQPALRSADPEERRGGRYVLETFSKRNDLYADVDRTLAQLGLAEHDTQPPTALEVAAGGGDQHAPTVPEAPAEGRENLLADPQWVDALNAYWAKRWVEAVDRFEALQGRYPGESRVETRLEQARGQRDIAAWSEQADAAARAEDWDTVVTALENLTALDATYPDAAARLEQARTAQRRKALVDEMTALHQAGRWDAVVAAAEELARLDPEHPDPGGIVSDAQGKIRDAQLADRYARALNQLDQEHWEQAAELFTAIEQEQPGFRDAAALLTTAQRQRDLAAWSDQAAAAAGRDDWDAAVTVLENICAVDPAYRDAGAQLEQTRSTQRLRALVDKVTALHQAGRWKDVVAAEEELAQLDPDHPDPGGVVSDAKSKIREAEFAGRYAQGVNHLKEQHWQKAVAVFTAIEQEQPGYRDATALLKTAQQNLRETAEAKQRASRQAQPPPQTTTPAPPEKTTSYPLKTTPPPPEKKASPADLDALVAQSARLTHEEQREIFDRLQQAFRSADADKRKAARDLLDRFSRRDDLYQDLAVTVAQWRVELPSQPVSAAAVRDDDGLTHTATRDEKRIDESVSVVRATSWRPYILVAVGLVAAVILIAILIALNSRSSSPSSDQVIQNASVGDCIHRTMSTSQSDGTLSVVVSAAICGTSYATDKVIMRTDDTAKCPSGAWWVRTTPYAPPIVLCLSQE